MKEKVDIIVEKGKILTLDSDRLIITNGAIAIKNGRIVAVGKNDRIIRDFNSEKRINAKDKVVLPGLVDSHVHLSNSLVKGLIYGEPIPLGLTYMPFGESLNKEQVHIAALLSCLERIKTGVTCIGDVGSRFPDEVAKAAVNIGVRATVSYGMRDKEIPGFPYSRPLPPGQNTKKALNDAELFHKKWDNAADGRLKVWFSTNIWSTSDELYIRTKELADHYGSGINDHLDQHRHEIEYSIRTWKERPVEHLDRLGVLGRNFVAHHMVFVADREIPILRKKEVTVCHCPRAALNSHGIPKFPLFNALGINCVLGTDMRISDMFELMRLASYVFHGTSGLYYYDPLVLPAESLIEMVTINGAKAYMQEKETGSIEVGKKADLVIVDFNKPHLTPSFDVIAELTRYVYGSDVVTVIIDGTTVMEDRVVKTVNEQEIIDKAAEIGLTTYERTKEKIKKTVPVNRWKVV